ncbi:hypothetical protein PQC39_gp130 [Vibrio phage Vp_R1]|uniref:Uncharacterized protein n=1 Tax=Vibrio phage Vp_R1 TaxID=2059867 RepID=A0A2H5BQ86_9CAUD|nr:hypothetical protein PQC39_gp130 [Vibrio phage Vp_R1]AUG88494.1 hypothetical protein VPR_130 [Vibrio phage Vp_R1]
MGMRNVSDGNFTPALSLGNMSQDEVKYIEDIQGDSRSDLRKRLDAQNAPKKDPAPFRTSREGVLKALNESPTITPTGEVIRRKTPTYLPDSETNDESAADLKATFSNFFGRPVEEDTTEPAKEQMEQLEQAKQEELKKGSDVAVQGDPTAPRPDKEKIAEIEKAQKQILPDLGVELMGEQSRRGFEENWEQNNHFPETALRFFLNVLSGVPIGAAYMDASDFYDNRQATDRRHAYREELLEDGYSPESIEKWITTGNQDDLFDRDKRMMDRRKDELGLSQSEATLEGTLLGNQQKQNELDAYDPDYENKMKDLELEHKLAQIGASKASAQASLAAVRKAMQPNIPYSKMTESQNTAYNAMQNMIAGNSAFNNTFEGGRVMDGKTYPGATFLGEVTSRLMDNSGVNGWSEAAIRSLPGETMKALRLERDFLAGIMRKESGAAVSASEWQTRGSTFFPRRDDTPQDIARKSLLRELAIMNMQSQTGYSKWDGEKLGELQGITGNVVGYNPSTQKYIFSDGSAATLEQIQSVARLSK